MSLEDLKTLLMEYADTTRAAQMLGCSEATIKRMCKDGRLIAEKIYGDWFIDINSIKQFKEKK